jgi:hypothetical protein
MKLSWGHFSGGRRGAGHQQGRDSTQIIASVEIVNGFA